MLGVLLAASLAAAPAPPAAPVELDVLLARRTAVPPERAAAIARRVQAQLAAAGLKALGADELGARLKATGFQDTLRCKGARTCLVELGRQLGGAGVVAVTVGAVRGDLAVALELFRTSDGARVAQHSFIVAARGLDDLQQQVAPFSAAVARAFPPPPGPEVDRPQVEPPPPPPPRLVPAPSPPEPIAARPLAAPPAPSRAPALVAGGGALATAGAAGVLLWSALDQKRRLDGSQVDLGGGQFGSSLPYAQATALRDGANLQASLALGSAVLSAALAGVAVLLWNAGGP